MNLFRRFIWHLKHERNPWEWMIARILFYTGLGKFFTFHCGRYRLRFYPSGVSLSKWHNPSYGREDEEILTDLLRPGDTVVDVGANVGTMALTAASIVGPQGKVIAFEPNDRVYHYLLGNIKLNRFSQIEVRSCALGAESGFVQFSDDIRDDQNKVLQQGGRTVPIETLDEQLHGVAGRIRLLKVDVEGYEKFVFLGATATLSRTDYIYFEVFDGHFKPLGYTTSDLLDMILKAGFAVFQIGPAGERIPIDRGFLPAKCMNLLAQQTSL